MTRPSSGSTRLIGDSARTSRTARCAASTAASSRPRRRPPTCATCSTRAKTCGPRPRGYFDAYATGHLDPSGYVKGWSVQVASDRLLAAGAVNHCINAGGDIRRPGRRSRRRSRGGSASPIPWERHKVAWVVAGTDLAIATSGTYERGLHVIDPFTGEPADFLCSVTVCRPEPRHRRCVRDRGASHGLSRHRMARHPQRPRVRRDHKGSPRLPHGRVPRRPHRPAIKRPARHTAATHHSGF